MEKQDAFEIMDGILVSYNGNEENVIIPDTVKKIDCDVFWGNENIKSISMGTDVQIANEAFRGCKGLADDKGFVIVNHILYDYFGGDEDVHIPEDVVRISRLAFRHNHLSFCTYDAESPAI